MLSQSILKDSLIEGDAALLPVQAIMTAQLNHEQNELDKKTKSAILA
ncbi:MAG TPA: hypothetical protein PK843_06800 [bacterium]|nr:hypothetical protein [bacterium]